MRKKEKEITDLSEIESIIKNCDVCRLAFANGDIPYMVTMNFGYHRGEKRELFFHCANEGRKLEMIRNNNYVCFEMDTDHDLRQSDQACEFAMKYKSVVGYGYISIAGPAEKISGMNHIMSHYCGKGPFSYKHDALERATILKLEITEISGKKS